MSTEGALSPPRAKLNTALLPLTESRSPKIVANIFKDPLSNRNKKQDERSPNVQKPCFNWPAEWSTLRGVKPVPVMMSESAKTYIVQVDFIWNTLTYFLEYIYVCDICCCWKVPDGVIFSPANSTVSWQNLNLVSFSTIPFSGQRLK